MGFGSGKFQFFWKTAHFISSRHDGNVDIRVYTGIDPDGSGKVSSGVSAWVYARGPDHRVEYGEYLGPSLQRRIPVKDGVIQLQSVHGLDADAPRVGEPLPGGLGFAQVMRDIDSALARS